MFDATKETGEITNIAKSAATPFEFVHALQRKSKERPTDKLIQSLVSVAQHALRFDELRMAGDRQQGEERKQFRSASSVYIKLIVMDLIERSGSTNQVDLMKELERITYCYAAVVEMPRHALTLEPDKIRRFYSCYMAVLAKDPLGPKPEEGELRQFHDFCEATEYEANTIKKGILGEFFAFGLFKRLKIKPSLADEEEDTTLGVDMWVRNLRGEYVPIQVETDSKSPGNPFKISREQNSPTVNVALNTARILRDMDIMEAIIYPTSQKISERARIFVAQFGNEIAGYLN